MKITKLIKKLLSVLGITEDKAKRKLIEGLDANQNGRIDLDDFSKANRKKINWLKVIFYLLVLAFFLFLAITSGTVGI